MTLIKVTDEWVPLQIKVFTRWVNGHLKSIEDDEIEDITKDLSTGVHLVNLAQVLTQKEPPRSWSKEPKMQVFMVQNCDLAIEMFKDDGIQLVGISGKDINDNNVKLILGLVWTLILNYSIGKSISSVSFDMTQSANKSSSKNALMNWAVKKTADYPNVNPDFQPYDLSMCALLDSYYPDKINYHSLNPEETEKNAQLATDVMNELGIPVYIYPDDIIKSGNKVDDKTLLTQLSSAKFVLDDMAKKKERSVIIKENENESDEKSEIESSKNAIKCLKYEVRQLKKVVEGKSFLVTSEENKKLLTISKEEIQQFTKCREEYRTEIEHVKSEITEIRSQLTITNNENSSSQNNEVIEKISKEREEDKSEIERLKNDISELRTQLANSKNESASSQNNEEIERLKNDISELRTQLTNSKNEGASSQSNDGQDLYKSEIERLQNEFSRIQEQFTTILNEDESEKTEIKCLKYEVRQLKKSSNDVPVVQERSITINDLDESSQSTATAQQKEEYRTEIESLRNDISELRTQLTNSKNENNLLKEKLDSLSNDFKNNNNSEQLPEVKERSVNLDGSDANEQLQKDVQSLQSELQALKSKPQSDNTKFYIIIIILIILLICIKLGK